MQDLDTDLDPQTGQVTEPRRDNYGRKVKREKEYVLCPLGEIVVKASWWKVGSLIANY